MILKSFNFRLIKEQLAGKTRILVTHATHFLSEVDRIVVMDTEVVTDGNKTKVVGKISHVGTYSELVSKGGVLLVNCTNLRPKSQLIFNFWRTYFG